jgi:hypothetical protein
MPPPTEDGVKAQAHYRAGKRPEQIDARKQRRIKHILEKKKQDETQIDRPAPGVIGNTTLDPFTITQLENVS